MASFSILVTAATASESVAFCPWLETSAGAATVTVTARAHATHSFVIQIFLPGTATLAVKSHTQSDQQALLWTRASAFPRRSSDRCVKACRDVPKPHQNLPFGSRGCRLYHKHPGRQSRSRLWRDHAQGQSRTDRYRTS